MMIDHKALYEKCKPYSILFAEDFLPLHEKVTEIIEDYFGTVISTTDGQEAWEKYQEYEQKHNKPIDIILTDISMPRKNGLDLCRDIKELHPNQVIVILSAHQDADQLIKFINMGIAHYILKPINPIDLLDVMDSVTQLLISPNNIGENISDKIELGEEFIWDKSKSMLLKDEKELDLTRYDLIIMELMIKKLNHICTIDELISYFYTKGVDLDAKNIRSSIFRLRQKLPKGCISSLYAVGYKLTQKY